MKPAGHVSRFLRISTASVLLLLCVNLLSSCAVYTQKRELVEPTDSSSLNKDSEYLKAHVYNGGVYILNAWEVNSEEKTIIGAGVLLNQNREVIGRGSFEVPLDSVAIFETNVNKLSGSVIAMSVITGASVALTIYCIANPKACFGSCPTFYADDGEKMVLVAEGFSSSVAPSLEKTDVDALYRAVPSGSDFTLKVTNDALETHMIRYADLLILKRPEKGRVLATDKHKFFQAERLIEPALCVGPEGDCLDQLIAYDGYERVSLADSTYLGTKEMIELEFDIASEDGYGLVIASRQSLMSTYLFYQMLAYMGRSAGEYMANLERFGTLNRNISGGIGNALGGIEVLIKDTSGDWRSVGEIGETGPLAVDTKIVPLPGLNMGGNRIKLRFTRGFLRLDYVALAKLGDEIEPVRLKPSMVFSDTQPDDSVLALLHDDEKYVITLPGDSYRLHYTLPEDYADYELFLESRGYYMEWMREEWLAEENKSLAAMMIFNPEKALRYLAPEFKKAEPDMEEMFWNSKYVR